MTIEAVTQNYLEHCRSEYLRGWSDQELLGVIDSEDSSQMYFDGFQDAYAYQEMMSNRRAK